MILGQKQQQSCTARYFKVQNRLFHHENLNIDIKEMILSYNNIAEKGKIVQSMKDKLWS